MAEFIEVLSPTALADLEKLNAKLIETVSTVDKINAKFKTISTPSGVDSATNDLSQKYKELEATVVKLQAQLQKSADANVRNAEKTRLAEIKLSQDREKAFDKYEKQLAREQAKLKTAEGAYQRIQNGLNSMTNAYRDLAIRKELNGTLTKGEEKQFAYLQARIQKFDTALKAVDASMGKYQRNVGNYSSAFNPLNNSINQLTREMPAFANSVQTGFMAISNNLPIFFDSMQQVIAQNKELQKQGQPTKSLFSQLAGAVFSFGTALSVGVTLLTVYGKDIAEWASNLMKGGKAIDVIGESQRQLNEINKEGQKNAVEEQLKVKSLLEIAKDQNLSYKERVIAVKELQSTYPAYFGNLEQEKILAGQTKDAENELTQAILSRAKANAAVEKITENQSKIIDFELERLDLLKKVKTAEQDVANARKVQTQTTGGGTVAGTYDLETSAMMRLTRSKSSLVNVEKQLAELKGVNDVLSKFAIENQKKSIKLDQESTKAKKEKAKAEKESVDPSSLQAMEDMISNLEKQMKQTDVTSETYNYLGGVLKMVKLSYDALVSAMQKKEALSVQSKGVKTIIDGNKLLHESTQQAIKDFEEQAEATKKQKEELEKLKKTIEDYAVSFSSDFFSKSGFPTLFKVLNDEIEGFGDNWAVTFQAIAEIGQETFNFISQLSQQRFKNEYDNLAKEKEIALAFAGESTAGREEIERQFQERQSQIKRREFKAKQQEAMFNIAIDTAQAIVGAIAKSPATGGMPWTAIIAAMGAIQLGVVASQQIPEYWTGTDNAQQGWAWTQEKGREIITDKNGRIKSTGSDKGASLTYLNKGDKVYNAQKSALMFDNALNGLLMQNGIAQPKVEVNNVILDSQVDRIVNAVGSIDPVSLNIDKRGLNAYVRNGHSTKEIQNLRITGKGRKV